MRLMFAQETTLSTEWHRVDFDAVPVPSVALCGYMSTQRNISATLAPWSVIWNRRTIEPSGARCASCEDLAMRLTAPIESPLSGEVGQLSDGTRALLGADILDMLADL